MRFEADDMVTLVAAWRAAVAPRRHLHDIVAVRPLRRPAGRGTLVAATVPLTG